MLGMMFMPFRCWYEVRSICQRLSRDNHRVDGGKLSSFRSCQQTSASRHVSTFVIFASLEHGGQRLGSQCLQIGKPLLFLMLF